MGLLTAGEGEPSRGDVGWSVFSMACGGGGGDMGLSAEVDA
jgi:hypothetical protein